MTLSEYRETKAWQQAIELGPKLVKLAEELPQAEQVGLGQQLRQQMVDLPAMVAMDLVDGSSVRLHVAMRLTATLELVERVYPALDAAAAKTALAELTERLASDQFEERVAAPAPPAMPEVLAESETADLPNEGEATPAPATSTIIPISNEEAPAVHVQPDSRQ